jgi:predicted 2-oxoglutarate/Fe(II)-dependent dioxygenase YbiX
MYYPNDDYDGGEIVFPDYDLKIKPKPNSLIMFPGNENYLHGVLEVLKGFRHTFQVSFIFSGSTFVGPTTEIRQMGGKNYG